MNKGLHNRITPRCFPVLHADPCVNLKEGEYVLDRRFHELFSYVDPQCYFVKCANKKAYLNPCSTASRNNQVSQREQAGESVWQPSELAATPSVGRTR